MLRVETLLVPVDFSKDAEAALDQAIGLAKSLGARIHLLYVHHLPALMGSAWSFPVDLATNLRTEAEGRLANLREKVEAEGIDAIAEIEEGVPSETIVARATAIPASLIVMGTRGRTGVEHVILGSVAERTLRRAPCPVMTVKAGYEA